MSASATALPRASATVLSRLHAVKPGSAIRPCQHLLRQFSQTRYHFAAPQKVESSGTAPYQSYTLNPQVSPAPRNEPVAESSIASPIPKVHETRPLGQAQQTPPESSRQTQASATPATEPEVQKSKAAPPRRKLRPRKAAMKLTPTAVEQLRDMLSQPDPKLIKVGVRNRGCSGLAYHLEYVDKPGAFDETVEQDGVKVLIDSKALFSIIGSEMDWVEDKLNQRFVFRNPNIKEECGCGESFMV